MTKEEYDQAKAELYTKYQQDQYRLAVKYAFENNPYKVGDVISQGNTTIKIESIKVYGMAKDPECVYTGVWLKKDGTPNKKAESATIYQSNIGK